MMRVVVVLAFVCVAASPVHMSKSLHDGKTRIQASFGFDGVVYAHPYMGVMHTCPSCWMQHEDGEHFSYKGPLLKTRTPTRDKYIAVEGNDPITLFDASLVEWFDIRDGGYYTLYVSGVIALMRDEEEMEFARVDARVWVRITEDDVAAWEVKRASRSDLVEADTSSWSTHFSIKYTENGCSAAQASNNLVVNDLVEDGVNTAMSYLNSGCRGCPYVEIFGAFLSSRYTIVRNAFVAVQSKVAASSFIVDCTAPAPCADDILAFVYAGDASHRIHLCNDYWTLPTSWAIDSRPGTWIHELTHFSDIAGTADHVYGLAASKALAAASPALAVDNADNFEYFVEQGLVVAGCDTSTSCSVVGPPVGTTSDAFRTVPSMFVLVVCVVLYCLIWT